MEDKQRLQFDFTKPAVDQLDVLVDRLNASSRAEVVRRALALLDHATEPGTEVFLRTEAGGDLYKVVFL